MSKVAIDFVSGETLPDVKPGNMRAVLVVTRSEEGKSFCYAGYYLNRYPLEYEDLPDDAETDDYGMVLTTGWFHDESNWEYDNCYHAINRPIVAWASLPSADSVLAAINSSGGDHA